MDNKEPPIPKKSYGNLPWMAEEMHKELLHSEGWGVLRLFNSYYCKDKGDRRSRKEEALNFVLIGISHINNENIWGWLTDILFHNDNDKTRPDFFCFREDHTGDETRYEIKFVEVTTAKLKKGPEGKSQYPLMKQMYEELGVNSELVQYKFDENNEVSHEVIWEASKDPTLKKGSVDW